MTLRYDSRVAVGGLLGLLAALFAEEVITLVPVHLKSTYRAAILMGIMFSLFYLTGLSDASIQYFRCRRRRKIPWPIGVISGYESHGTKGRQCRPAFSSKNPKDWIRFLEGRNERGKSLFAARLIHPSEASERYAVIFNPFGEVFPDSDLEKSTDFQRIVDYIRKGGIFVNCGGYPFYYNWNYDLERMVDTTPRTTSISIVQHGGIAVTSAELFSDSMAAKHFGLFIKNGSVSPKHRLVYQHEVDRRRFGDLTLGERTLAVKEFRALEKETANLLPGLRSRRNGREVYPLAAVQVGKGYIIPAGMEVASDSDLRLISHCVENFLRRLQE
jgi:hypothetical protein